MAEGGPPPQSHPPDDGNTIAKCQPTKVQCSHSPGSLLSETQDEALDVGHCCNPKNRVNGVLHVLFDTFSQTAFHFSLINQSLGELEDWLLLEYDTCNGEAYLQSKQQWKIAIS